MQGPTRIKFDLEKLKDPQAADAFQAKIVENLHQSPYSMQMTQKWTH